MKGFLPKEPPLREYQKSSPSLDRLQEIAHNLPKLLLTSQVQPTVESLTKNETGIYSNVTRITIPHYFLQVDVHYET